MDVAETSLRGGGGGRRGRAARGAAAAHASSPAKQVPVRQVGEGADGSHKMAPAVKRTDDARDEEEGITEQRHDNGVDCAALKDKYDQEQPDESRPRVAEWRRERSLRQREKKRQVY